MLDGRSLLGTLLEAQSGRTAQRRVGHATGQGGAGGSFGDLLGGLGGAGGLGGLLSGLGGSGGLGGLMGSLGGRSGGAGTGGGGLGDILGQMGAGGGGLGGVLGEAKRGNPMAAGGIGALAGAVLGGGKGNVLKGAVGGGAIAVLGALALNALTGGNRDADDPAPAQPAPAQPASAQPASAKPGSAHPAQARPRLDPAVAVPQDEAGQEQRAHLLLRAMLSAAKADGQIDGNEMQRILGKLDEDGGDAESKSYLLDEMRKPVDIEALAREAGGRPEVAAEIYAASLLAIEVDTDAERDYLARLASALRLDPAAVDRLHGSLGAAPVA